MLQQVSVFTWMRFRSLLFKSVACGGHFGRVFNRLATSPKLLRFTSRGGSRLPQAIRTLEQIGSWS